VGLYCCKQLETTFNQFGKKKSLHIILYFIYDVYAIFFKIVPLQRLSAMKAIYTACMTSY